jgi:hypothetical protein
MATKPTNAHTCIKISDIINKVMLVHVPDTLVAILMEMQEQLKHAAGKPC